jgi:hypothetical protein
VDDDEEKGSGEEGEEGDDDLRRLSASILVMETEQASKTLVSSPNMTRLMASKGFSAVIRRESSNLANNNINTNN